jgi:hypothetical protein
MRIQPTIPAAGQPLLEKKTQQRPAQQGRINLKKGVEHAQREEGRDP